MKKVIEKVNYEKTYKCLPKAYVQYCTYIGGNLLYDGPEFIYKLLCRHLSRNEMKWAI